jgi:hypothetical protein
MRTVYKYTLQARDDNAVSMPVGATILSAQVQDGDIQIWALVDPDAKKETRYFGVAGTGHPIDDNFAGKFIGTVQMYQGALVFHVFEVLKNLVEA